MPDRVTLPHWGGDVVSRLATRVVGHPDSQYQAAIEALNQSIRDAVQGRRILVLGAAGFIARQTLSVLLPFRPAYVGLVDVSENGLAELIRGLRSSDAVRPETTVHPWLADIGSPSFTRLVRSLGNVDLVLNFAAVKHVRSERDVTSLLRMLEVNIVAVHHSAVVIASHNPLTPQFVVSTDKAADPSNFMGASKRAMEMALASLDAPITTARFANVAFSSGSLLESWLMRLAERQPLAVPESTWRYFVTPREAGHLCAAASVAPAGSAVIPQFAPADLILLEDALRSTLEFFDLAPVRVSDVDAARAQLEHGAVRQGFYPYFVTPLDTAGEKPAEQLLGLGEDAESWQTGLDIMRMTGDRAGTAALISWISGVIAGPENDLSTLELGQRLSAVVRNFRHGGGTSRLDDRV